MKVGGLNMKTLHGKTSHPGSATGEVLLLTEPVSFWGGVDHLGNIIDVHHAQHKAKMTDKILVMPSGRGSSSATAVLAELIRTGDGPKAIVMQQCDTILVIGALVSAEIYGISMPIVELAQSEYAQLRDGQQVSIEASDQTQKATVTLL
jgi:predicted aconitase with swiveling domain